MDGIGTLLVVCTANICRSPLAERVIDAGLPELAVLSAGVRAVVGAPMCAVSALELPDGIAGPHAARQVDAQAIRAADLVVAMEREQRGALVREAPGTQAAVFTLREAAALAGALADAGEHLPDLAAVAAAMHAQRGLTAVPADPDRPRRWWQRAAAPEDPLTIPDGHGGPDPAHRAAAAAVHRHAEALARALAAVLPG